ncbi:MAG TPA: MFS transporter [Candidatus Acidoferrales bacterium]|nr:MFS transporter [Candidatus Acidoferrales bacterium]
MKTDTFKLCLPAIAITVQNNAAALILPPFLHDLKFPVAAIGSLMSLGPVLALASRLPTGMAYNRRRARVLLSLAILAMAACNFLYSLVTNAVSFGLVHAASGFAYGASTTLYMAFYVDSLPADENRSHAMGYYVGSLAVGYSIGNFLAGYLADRLGYGATFYAAALLALAALVLIALIKSPQTGAAREERQRTAAMGLRRSLKTALEPNVAAIVTVALFLNMLHQVGNVFLPLYGLSIGLSLTQVGVIRALYSLCNAVTRPLSGLVVQRLGHRRLSYGGLPLQSALMMLVPLLSDFAALTALYVSAGFVRAVALVSNAVGLVEDIDEAKISRGVATGLYNAAGDLGNILGPTAGGFVASVAGVAGLFVVAPLGAALLFLATIGLVHWRWEERAVHSGRGAQD